jgi:type VI secretion system protein ImpH
MSQVIREYSLFQAVLTVLDRLRERHPQLDDEQLYNLLEFQANPDLGFPRSDVEHVEFFEEKGQLRARLRLNVIALFGVGSPLPAFYSEQVLDDHEDDFATRMFFDVFHDRLQRLLLPIWLKYRYRASYRNGASDRFSQLLFSVVGLGGEAIRKSEELNWKRLLPYLGMLSLRAHSAALIEAVLRYYFKHSRLYIEQCVERLVRLHRDDRNSLALKNSQLGLGTVLGETTRDRGGKFRIHILELGWARFHDLLPIGKSYPALCALVRFTLRDPLEYDVRLQLRKEEIRELRIGERNSCHLGWATWLGRERADGLVTLGQAFH